MAALRECISISHLSIYRPSSFVCVTERERERERAEWGRRKAGKWEGGTRLWQVSIVNCQVVVCCCHWQFANGIWQALSLIPARVERSRSGSGSWSQLIIEWILCKLAIWGLFLTLKRRSPRLASPGLASPRVCPEVVKVAAQLTAAGPWRMNMMMSVAKLCVSLSEKSSKGITFFCPISSTVLCTKATNFSEAHRNDTMPIGPLTHWCQLCCWWAEESQEWWNDSRHSWQTNTNIWGMRMRMRM